MRLTRASCVAVTLLASPLAGAAQTPDITLMTPPQTFANGLPTYVNAEGRIPAPSDAAELINLTLKKLYPTEVDTASPDFYAIVHVLLWSDPSDSKQKVQRDNWYVYHPGADWTQAAFTTGKRLFGVQRAWFLYVHVNVMSDRVASCSPVQEACSYRPRYEVFVKQKLPTNAANAVQLITLFSELEADRAPTVTSVWGGAPMQIDRAPSDVTIHPKLMTGDQTAPLSDAQTFDNEGRHWWDVSFGVPTRSIKELKVDTTAATAAPKEIEKQRLFALLNFYFRPIDLKAGGLVGMPHLVAGTAFAKKPLERILIAAGWGPVFANLYAGVLFVREPKETLPDHDYKPQFAIGINLPVRAIAEKLKKPKG